MCLASRRKVHFKIEMDLDVILSESTPAARCQMRRLGKFAYTEHSVIKCASVIFAASRHRKLSVGRAAEAAFRTSRKRRAVVNYLCLGFSERFATALRAEATVT